MLMAKINENEKIFFNCKKEIQTKKRIELSRVSKEFLTNDFERRYNVTQDVVVSAICGEDNMNQELSRLLREQKVILFFKIFKGLYWEYKAMSLSYYAYEGINFFDIFYFGDILFFF